MANKAYRSIATGNWSNSGNTVWQVYSVAYDSGTSSFPTGGAWALAGANVYPTSDDFVWIQGANVVTYDLGTAVTGSFKQISRQIAAHIGYAGTVAQPGTGGSDASTGYIVPAATATSTIRSIYYIIGSGLGGTIGFFTITGNNVTLNAGLSSGSSYFCEGTGTSKILDVNSGLSNTSATITTDTTLKSGGTSANIRLASVGNYTITCSSIDLTNSTTTFIDTVTLSPTLTINGDLYGSNGSTVACISGSGNPTITINGSTYAGVQGACIWYTSSSYATGSVTVTGNIRNHGLSGATPSGQTNAIIGSQIRPQSSTIFYFNFSGISTSFSTSATPSAAAIWNYLTSNATTAGSLGKLIVDNLNATVSSRATQTSVDTIDDFLDTEIAAIKTSTDRIPTNPASVQSTGEQIATIN